MTLAETHKEKIRKHKLAEEACKVEIDMIKNNIGSDENKIRIKKAYYSLKPHRDSGRNEIFDL